MSVFCLILVLQCGILYAIIMIMSCWFSAKCVGGQRYSECGAGCAPTCDDTDPMCSLDCVSGCVCPSNRRIFDVAKQKCVTFRDCSIDLTTGTGSQFVSLSISFVVQHYYNHKPSTILYHSLQISISNSAIAVFVIYDSNLYFTLWVSAFSQSFSHSLYVSN